MNNLLEYLEATAERCPDKAAFEDTSASVSFSRLLYRAKLAGAAVARRVRPRQAVCVYMDKSVDAVAAFMAVLYAGCFYCYLDPKQPAARTGAMLSAAQPGLIITGAGLTAPEGFASAELSALEAEDGDEALLASIRSGHIGEDPAYCSFTSGSTGSPKGVLVSHRSVIDFIDVFAPLFSIGEEDVLACQSPFDFDVSVKDIFSGLKTGATVELIPKYFFVFLPNLMEFLRDRRVTTLIWAVSALCLLSERGALEFCRPPLINKILFSGEVMPPRQLLCWKEQYPDAMLVNLYGPTEITCNCTYHILPPDYSGGEIPIGRPFPNERVFLLGEDGGELTAPGAAGELCVAGAALALGYLGLPDATAAAFVQNPLTPRWSQTIYKTGDMARYGEDGLLYYAGRRDHQIKRHGRRVELGEIESALCSLEGVGRACVLYVKDTARLVAYISTVGELPRAELNKRLKALLPDYMIPDEYIAAESLPLNAHGKLDRAALLAMYTASLPEADNG